MLVFFWQIRFGFGTCEYALIFSFSISMNLVQFNPSRDLIIMQITCYNTLSFLVYWKRANTITIFYPLIFRLVLKKRKKKRWLILLQIKKQDVLFVYYTCLCGRNKSNYLAIPIKNSLSLLHLQNISLWKKSFFEYVSFWWLTMKEKKEAYYASTWDSIFSEYNLCYWSIRNDGDIGNRWIRLNEIAGCKMKEK